MDTPVIPYPVSRSTTPVGVVVPTAANVFVLWRQTFSRDAPKILTDVLLQTQSTHPQECLEWAFTATASISKPTWKYTEKILMACDNEGHGPREGRRNGVTGTNTNPAGDGERAASALRALESRSENFEWPDRPSMAAD